MNVGIYCYMDSLNDEIVYIGKDSYIGRHQRSKDHLTKSRYNDQPFNRILQNNPNRYIYKVLKSWDGDSYHENLASVLEIIYIRRYNPKYNYTVGGDGRLGSRLTEEHKQKISEANKGKIVSKETREKISKANKGKPGPNKGKKFSKETREKISKSKIGVYKDEKNPRYRPDIPSPQELYEEWKSGTSQKELMEKYNCGDATIKRRLRKVKKEDGRYNPNIPSNEILFNEWQGGLTQKELANKYGCSVSQIEHRMRAYKEENNISVVKTNHGKNAHNFRSDIPDGEELIGEMNQYQMSYKQLAEKYRCSESLINHRIRKIKNKKIIRRFTHVPSGEDLLKEYENSNYTQKELAEKYNCTIDCIKGRIRSARKNKYY